jgi:hypothetical protein
MADLYYWERTLGDQERVEDLSRAEAEGMYANADVAYVAYFGVVVAAAAAAVAAVVVAAVARKEEACFDSQGFRDRSKSCLDVESDPRLV